MENKERKDFGERERERKERERERERKKEKEGERRRKEGQKSDRGHTPKVEEEGAQGVKRDFRETR